MSNPLPDPVVQSIASTLAGQAATVLTEAGKKALAKIRDLLTRKSAEDPETSTRWEAAEDREPDHPKVQELAEHLQQLASTDQAFQHELHAQGAILAHELETNTSTTTNYNSGSVGNLVQGDSFGDITFN